MYKKLMFLISFVAVLSLANIALADDAIEWDGGGADNSWCTCENWSDDACPGPGEEVQMDPIDDACDPPWNDVLIDCDVNVGYVMGPRSDSDANQAITIVSGASAVFTGWRIGEDGDGTSFVNITGGNLTVLAAPDEDWAIRAADSGNLIWTQSGGTVNCAGYGGRMRVGDNGGTRTDFNISGSAVINMDGEWKWGDDGDVYMTMDGGEINIGLDPETADDDGDWIFEARDGENHAVINDGAVYVGGSLRGGNHDNVASLTMNGGSVDAGEVECPAEDGPMTITMNGGTLIARGELRVGNGEGTLIVDGGTVQCADLKVQNNGLVNVLSGTLEVTSSSTMNLEGGLVNITEGTLKLKGDQQALVAAYAAEGKIGGYYTSPPGVFRSTITAVYDSGTDTTTVTALAPNLAQAWGPNPVSGATKQVVGVVLTWYPGDYVGLTGRQLIYFGDDEAAIDAIATGDMSTPYYMGWKKKGQESFAPADKGLTLDLWKTYYWRIDEYNKAPSPPELWTKGKVWSFTTGCELITGDMNLDCVVDFKDYAMLAEDWGKAKFFP